jgi:DNA-binding XRE family transcriptional regulator
MAQKITLKAARVNAGYTQAEMAEKLGISREIVNGWESGRVEIKPVYLLALCYVTGFKTDDIFLPERFTCSEEEE